MTKPDHTVSISPSGLKQAVEECAPGGALHALFSGLQGGSGAGAPLQWVCSPYLRTQQTAAVLRTELRRSFPAASFSPEVLHSPLLHERGYPNLSFGSYEHDSPGWVGFTFDERERFVRAEKHAGYYFFRSPGGENTVDVGLRAEALLAWLGRALGEVDTVVLVSHASCIADMVTWLLETPPELADTRALGWLKNLESVVLLRKDAGEGAGPPRGARFTLDPMCATFAARLTEAHKNPAWGGPGWLVDSLRALGYDGCAAQAHHGAAGTGIGERKAALRAAIRTALATLPPAALEEHSSAACAALLALPAWAQASTVALYLPLASGRGGRECNVEPLLGAALRAGKRVLLPRVVGPAPEGMTLLQVVSEREVAAWVPMGPLGLREPPAELPAEALLPAVAPGGGGAGATAGELLPSPAAAAAPLRADWRVALPDLVLVPGLAFDLRGGRLGKGKGYYDAWLKALLEECSRVKRQKPFIVACALGPAILPAPETIPCDPWDRPVDCIVGPQGVVYPSVD